MITPMAVDLVVDRWQPYVETFQFSGVTLDYATLRAQVRLCADAPGSPLLDLGMAAGPAADGFIVGPTVTTGGVDTNLVTLRIGNPSALPAASSLGGDAVLAWDLIITMPFADPVRAAAGQVTVRAGVTH